MADHGAADNRHLATGVLAAALALAGCFRGPAPRACDSTLDAALDSAGGVEPLAHAFIRAYNLNEPRTLTDFIRATYAESAVSARGELLANRDRWLRAYSLVGPVELRHVETVGPRRIHVWAYGLLTRTWMAFSLETGQGRSPAIIEHSIFSTSRPVALDPGPRLDPSELPEYLHSYLDGLASVDAFSGVALLVRGGEVVWSFAAGFVGGQGRPIDLETAFDLASVSKMFAAVAALELRDAGRVDFDLPVSRYLDLLPAHIGDKITLATLLSHRTGIRLQDDDELYARLFRAASFNEQFKLEVEAMERAYSNGFEPAGSYVYSNEGIDIAARVLETQAELGYYELLRDTIFAPLGMDATRPYRSTERSDLAGGRTRMHPPDARFVPGPRRSHRFFLYDMGRPSGGMVTTGSDMAAFCSALTSGTFLPEDSLRDMTSLLALQAETFDYQLYYGLGTDVYVYDDGIVFGHGGGRPGTSTRVDIFPDLDVSLIVLSNYDYIAHRIAEHVQEALMVGVF